MEGAKLNSRSGGNVVIAIGISAVLTFLVAGTAAGMTFATMRKNTGETPLAMGGGGECVMPDQNWTSPSTSEIPDSASVISKLGGRSIMPSKERIDQILQATRAAGVNPAVAIATWGKEQNFGKPSYAFGVAPGSTSFEDQLTKHVKTLTKARDNVAPYGNRPAGTAIQTWWIDAYTPESDSRNNVSEDREIFFTFLKQLVPGQIQCSSPNPVNNFVSGSLDFRGYGPGSSGQVGIWKSLSQAQSALHSKTQNEVEKQLVNFNFLGHSIRVNKYIVPALQNVVNDIKSSGSTYKIKDIGCYNWRHNVNSPSLLSPHSTGAACDINPGQNPNGRRSGRPRDPAGCPHDIPKAVSDAFEKNGFFWGAKFKGVCDAMHFQYGGNWS
ncbi:MAG: M15 family metallopeptidase [Patescibacteria group bacterium]|jgi:hypothetical protein